MAEAEGGGRPPEGKRSRKPAHPVKREINQEMKSFAESTMNELLGWYGYDKLELRDSEGLDLAEAAQQISVLRDTSLPNLPVASEGGRGSPDAAGSSLSVPAPRNGVAESSASTSGNPPIVPVIPPPLPPADEDSGSVQIMCAWCQKGGAKRYSLSMGSELKSFCSEKCFAACRRAYFKRNKVCDWCKHIRHTKEYLDFGAGERRLQFCSAKCLNQYKMDIFYKETQAALPGALCNPAAGADGKAECSGGVQLLTPESWGTPLPDLRRKAASPLGPSGCASPPPHSPSSLSAKIPTPRPHESPSLPPPPINTLHPTVGVPPGSPPMVMTPRGPMPWPLFMEHQMMQVRPPYLRPSHHPGGPNSPMPNPIIPGIGPPPARSHGAASSPMHRPLMAPHVHPSANPAPGMMPPHPGLSMPGIPPFPPVGMLPNGPVPFSPMMNFGIPSLAPLVPPPSLLVPYPVIVPLPVPIPIPIPIPLSPGALNNKLENSGPPHGTPGTSESVGGGSPSQRDRGVASEGRQSPGASQPNRSSVGEPKVKAEGSLGSSGSSRLDGVIDLTVGQRLFQQQPAPRMFPGVQVKLETDCESRSPPIARAGPGVEENSLLLPGDPERAATKPLLTQEKPGPTDMGAGTNRATPPPPANAALTHPQSLPQLQPSPAAPCNVIVNGTGCHSSRPEPVVGGVPSEGQEQEQEALKENTCSQRLEKAEWDKRGPAQDQGAGAAAGKPDPDGADEGKLAYALPLRGSGSCVVIQPVPKPGLAKSAILSCAITAPLATAESSELEPPHKRRCLRIRNQNK